MRSTSASVNVAAARNVLPRQAVGVLVRSSLPRAVRIGEAGLDVQRALDQRVLGELAAAIEGERPDQAGQGRERGQQRVRHRACLARRPLDLTPGLGEDARNRTGRMTPNDGQPLRGTRHQARCAGARARPCSGDTGLRSRQTDWRCLRAAGPGFGSAALGSGVDSSSATSNGQVRQIGCYGTRPASLGLSGGALRG